MSIVQSVAKNGSAVKESGLGGTIRELRKASSYRDMYGFAAQAGISKEGLRKIENGERLPNRETLARILDTGNVPADEALELQQLRDKTQAIRDGIDVPNYANDVDLGRLAQAAVGVFGRYLGEYDMFLPEEDQRHLRAEIKRTLKDRIA
jgi:transcriptional regulator with XRE-family HTH domain